MVREWSRLCYYQLPFGKWNNLTSTNSEVWRELSLSWKWNVYRLNCTQFRDQVLIKGDYSVSAENFTQTLEYLFQYKYVDNLGQQMNCIRFSGCSHRWRVPTLRFIFWVDLSFLHVHIPGWFFVGYTCMKCNFCILTTVLKGIIATAKLLFAQKLTSFYFTAAADQCVWTRMNVCLLFLYSTCTLPFFFSETWSPKVSSPVRKLNWKFVWIIKQNYLWNCDTTKMNKLDTVCW